MADRLIKWLGYSTLTELRFCFGSPLSRYVFTFSQRIEKSEVANVRKKRGEGGFAPKTENDPNENTQKETVTKELSGKRIQLKAHLF